MSKSEVLLDEKKTFVQHLAELRNSLIISIVAWIIGGTIFWNYVDEVFKLLTEPFGIKALVYIAPVEGFVTYLKISLFGGLVLASPVILFALLRFIMPGLYKKEKKMLFILIPGAVLMLLAGIAFGYYVMLPVALKYLLNFGTLNVQPMLSVQKYIGFICTTLIIMGVIFEVPLIIVGLTKIGIVTPKFLRKNRKYAIVLATVIGAILTPPDVISQVMMAGPLILLYEISIWLSYLFWRKKKKKESLASDV